MNRTRIVHVISDLSIGGAEQMLVKVCAATRETHEHAIVTLLAPGALHDAAVATGARVIPLGLTRSWRAIGGVGRLRARIRELKPLVVQSWMYHANVSAALAGGAPLVWGIRYTPSALSHETLLTRATILASAALARRPRRIVYNAEASRAWHEQSLYPCERGVVIPNGFNLDHFRPDPESRLRMRAAWSVPDDVPVIGRVARYHPMKDIPGLLEAARSLQARGLTFRLVLVGAGMSTDNGELTDLISASGLAHLVTGLGARDDVAKILPAFDIAVSSSSHGEAFPNVIGESMACGIPMVVTDVGDSANILDDPARTVPPSDPQALASALARLLSLPQHARAALGERDRTVAVRRYDIRAIGKAFTSVWDAATAKPSGGG